jgi:hypothetical protein
MSGELLREAAVLILVFAPLDAIFSGMDRLTWPVLSGIVGVGVALFVTGTVIERTRK